MKVYVLYDYNLSILYYSMYRSAYDVTPFNPESQPLEEKMRRDQIHFPRSLPSNTQKPMHQLNFIDRDFVTDRKANEQQPVQNDYLHHYQMNELQQINYNTNFNEQTQIDRIMEKKIPSDGNLLDRNRDQAELFGLQNHRAVPVQFMPTPTDTRKEKIDLNNQREVLDKSFGAPLPYLDRNLK